MERASAVELALCLSRVRQLLVPRLPVSEQSRLGRLATMASSLTQRGAEDPLYAQAGHENEARVKQRWGANYVNAVNLVERAYARNGMNPTGKEFVNHDKAIHFLSEMMDDPNTLKANQTRDYSRDGFMASVVDQALSMTAMEPADIR